jgi:membrane protease YdiL (CAAX protease family)
MFVLVAFLGAWWVFGARFSRVIPCAIPAGRHLALLLLLMLPLAVMDGFLAQQVIDIGENAFGHSPSQGDLPELLDGVSREASTGTLLLILAVMPALGEELVFRGLIGRGLIARKGIVLGVLWTSILFSVVHGNPVQAVGVFFVGVMCHVAYLATRSILAPMLLHFLNNTLPVIALKNLAQHPADDPAAADALVSNVHPLIAVAAMAAVAAIAVLFWKSRVEDLDEDGQVLRAGVPSVEPPANAVFTRLRPAETVWPVLAGIAYFLFLASVSLHAPA